MQKFIILMQIATFFFAAVIFAAFCPLYIYMKPFFN